MSESKWDVIIIGAGAAGLMCAAQAGQRGRKVLVLEHQSEIGKKVLISGGGRCNFTNLYAEADNYLSQNPHFIKSALARYTPYDFLALVERYGIQWYEKKLGQLFCRNSAKEIVDLLLQECKQAQVKIQTGIQVRSVKKTDVGFTVNTANQNYQSKALVLACGGLSIPKVGASDLGYRLLKQFGHPLVSTRPALVPLTLLPQDQSLTTLRGIALDSVVRFEGQSFRENTLFTHFGLSGPAILQISSYWQQGSAIEIDFLPEQDLQVLIKQAQQESPEQFISNYLKQFLPARWIQFWLENNLIPAKSLRQLSEADIQNLMQTLKSWHIQPSGTSGYGKAEVTAGGADTDYFSSKTMESKQVKGLYCIGELMDVTGWLGGYNFQWAWASAYAAGQAI